MKYQIRQIGERFVAFYKRGFLTNWKAIPKEGFVYSPRLFDTYKEAMIVLRRVKSSNLPATWSDYNICKIVDEGKL